MGLENIWGTTLFSLCFAYFASSSLKTSPFFFKLFPNVSNNTCMASRLLMGKIPWENKREAVMLRNGFVRVFKARECYKGSQEFGKSGKIWQIGAFDFSWWNCIFCVFRWSDIYFLDIWRLKLFIVTKNIPVIHFNGGSWYFLLL